MSASGTGVTLTAAEAQGLYDLIAMMSGGSPENVFDWEGRDVPGGDPMMDACARLYAATGHRIPDSMRPLLEGQPAAAKEAP
jgi:hypothetical protein